MGQAWFCTIFFINIFVLVLINIFVFVSIDIFVADSIEAGRLGRKRGGSPRPNPPSHPHKTNLKQTNSRFQELNKYF